MSACALTMRAPKAAPIAWWPRQTPRTGALPAKRRIISIDTPACSGVPGPGEITTASGASRSASSGVMASLRKTLTSRPSDAIIWTRL